MASSRVRSCGRSPECTRLSRRRAMCVWVEDPEVDQALAEQRKIETDLRRCSSRSIPTLGLRPWLGGILQGRTRGRGLLACLAHIEPQRAELIDALADVVEGEVDIIAEQRAFTAAAGGAAGLEIEQGLRNAGHEAE